MGAGLLVAGAMLLSSPGMSMAVPPPPPNPSDAQLRDAAGAVTQGVGHVSELINRIAQADQDLQNLIGRVQIKREAANKALVDLQRARSIAAEAAAAVQTAQRQLSDAGAAIQRAQEQFEQYVSTGYQQGAPVGSLTMFLGSDGPDDVLTRARLMEVVRQAFENAMVDLQRARAQEANQVSSNKAAKQRADAAADDARRKEQAAKQAIAEAEDAAQQQAAERARIEANKQQAEEELAAARNNVEGLQSQRAVYEEWDRRRQAEEAAARAAQEAARKAAAEAAARAAADSAAQAAADAVAASQKNGNLTGTVDTAVASKSAAQKIEIVIDRGMSQLGVRYSWGGGNANGPTLGVRDGGVADTYGDYKNVGYDCSGLMVYAFAGVGISLPKYSGYQYTAGKQVPVDQARRGDMLFWGPGGSQHVALYLGDGQMLEAPFSGGVVRVAPVRWSGIQPYAVRMIG
nr:C40 family peptidase [Tomitella gaofuii]